MWSLPCWQEFPSQQNPVNTLGEELLTISDRQREHKHAHPPSLQPVLRSRNILAGAGLKVQFRLQLRSKRKNSERNSVPSFQHWLKSQIKKRVLKNKWIFSSLGGWGCSQKFGKTQSLLFLLIRSRSRQKRKLVLEQLKTGPAPQHCLQSMLSQKNHLANFTIFRDWYLGCGVENKNSPRLRIAVN